jgi:hypothetical protein
MQQGQLKNHFLVSQNVKIVNISVHILWFYTLENVLSDLKHPIKAWRHSNFAGIYKQNIKTKSTNLQSIFRGNNENLAQDKNSTKLANGCDNDNATFLSCEAFLFGDSKFP